MPLPRPGVRPPCPHALSALIPAEEHPLLAHALGLPIVERSDLTPLLGPRLDQGRSSACSCHAAAAGLWAASGHNLPGFPSPHCLYSASGRIEAPCGGVLRDDGRQLASVLRAVRETGIGPMRAPTPDGRWSDVWTSEDVAGLPGAPPPNVCADLTQAEHAQCVRYDAGSHTIDPRGPAAIRQIIACLTSPAPAPVLVGGEVGAAFEGLEGDQDAQPDDPSDPDGGGHALLICGHRPLVGSAGHFEFRLCNSWGSSWDEDGECWASEAFVLGLWELHPLTCCRVDDASLPLLERLRAALRRLVP